MNQILDFAIIGGGLAGSLSFLALKHNNPGLRVHLYEKAEQLCGNHTWCFHESDIPIQAGAWLRPLISKTWNEQEVHFPEYSRTLYTPYHCLRAEDLAQKTRQADPKAIHCQHELTHIDQTPEGHYKLHFKGQPSVLTHSYLLARGWRPHDDSKSVGWQKFVGLELRLKQPHHLQRVILKDVRQPQIDGYRFFYTLPFSPTEVLVEDTYYSNHAILKEERIEKEILAYVEKQGWEVAEIIRRERGALPLYLSAPHIATDRGAKIEPFIGAESEFVHPVTGYSTPMTLKLIQAMIERSNLTVPSLCKVFRQTREAEKSKIKYLVLLNRMMFLAAKNETRYKILEKFYRFPEPMINRFYSGNLTWLDRLRIISGKPPVAVGDAMKALANYSSP